MYLYSREYIIGSNVLTASATVLVYDVFLTLNDEINYIWLQPWTLGTFLYWVNRYLPFADTFMALYLQMSVTNIPKCHTFYEAITWMIATGLMVSELILLLRTYAMWQRRRSILIGLGSMSFVTFGPGIALTFLEIKSFKFDEVPLGGLGCNLQTASKLIMISYVLIAFSETVVVVLTLMRGREHLRNSQSSWVKHIYRHGLLFYAYLLIITIINMVVPLVANEPQYKNYLAIPQRVFHSIFCNRVILLISRQRSRRSYANVEVSHRRSMTKSNLTGNMLDTAINTDYTRQIDAQSDPGEDEHEMSTYRQDWTR